MNSGGFTLTELIIVIAIVTLLATIAVPSYLDQTRKSRRADAKASLLQAAQLLERCFTLFTAYDNAACNVKNGTQSSVQYGGSGDYDITVEAARMTYTVSAAGATGRPAADDSQCTSFTLTHLGYKTATGSGAERCW